MKCSKAQKLISPYIDGELAASKKQEFEDHMRVCEKCRIEMEEMLGLRQLFVNAEKFDAPHGFNAKVMANVNIAGTWKLRGISIPLSLAEVGVVLILLAIGIIAGSSLTKGFLPQRMGNELASLHLEVFDAAPPGTLGGAYLAMTGERNEK